MKKKLILILLILIVLGVALFIGKNDIYKYLYPKKYSDYVEFYSKEYNLDENLVYSITKSLLFFIAWLSPAFAILTGLSLSPMLNTSISKLFPTTSNCFIAAGL